MSSNRNTPSSPRTLLSRPPSLSSGLPLRSADEIKQAIQPKGSSIPRPPAPTRTPVLSPPPRLSPSQSPFPPSFSSLKQLSPAALTGAQRQGYDHGESEKKSGERSPLALLRAPRFPDADGPGSRGAGQREPPANFSHLSS